MLVPVPAVKPGDPNSSTQSVSTQPTFHVNVAPSIVGVLDANAEGEGQGNGGKTVIT
jgi:hypothetical protein